MIRVALFLIAVALFALGFAWFADRPGEVSIVWGGWRVETSVMVGGVALLILVAALIFVWSLLRGVFSGPRRVREYWQRRQGAQGHLAISRGLIAIGAGDIRAAQKYTSDAQRLAPAEPLTLLLGAQTAQLAGDREAAEKTFRAMAGRPDTKLLGLRGLFVEAQRRADGNAAKLYAEEAAQSAPSLPWAGQAVLQLRSAAGDWAGALEMLERNRKTAAADKADYKRKRAVLLTAQALSLEHSDRDNAKTFALEAVKLAPDFVPAAALAGRFLAEAGELRKASRVVRAAWKDNPHPDLASAYIHLRFGDTARERLLACEGARGRASRSSGKRADGRARRARCARIRRRARGAGPAHGAADTARGAPHGGDRAHRARRRRPRTAMDGARAQCRARSGLDRGWLRVGALAADVAGLRPARCVRVEGAAGRTRRAVRAARGYGAAGAGRAGDHVARNPRATGSREPRRSRASERSVRRGAGPCASIL